MPESLKNLVIYHPEQETLQLSMDKIYSGSWGKRTVACSSSWMITDRWEHNPTVLHNQFFFFHRLLIQVNIYAAFVYYNEIIN